MAARATWGSHLPCLFLTSSRWHPAAFRSLKPFPLDSPLTRSRLRIRCCASPTIGRSDDGPKSTGSGEDGPGLAREEQIVGRAEGGHISVGGNLQGGIWQQVKDIAMFAAPATGLWLCSPMMSLIDTAVVGQSSAVELAALGPGTVVCDYLSFVFMFLSIATSNLVATSLARKDREEAQEHISMLLFIALVCGFGMLFVMKLFGNQILSDSGLGMACSSCGYGCSKCKFIGAVLMIDSLNKSGFSAFRLSIPSPSELLQIVELAAPVFITMFSKARMLLQSLVTIGIIAGCMLTTIGTVVPWLFPYIFTSDLGVSSEMRTVLLPYSVAILITPPTLSLEGTLLAGRDLAFLSLSMISCFCLGVLLLLTVNKGFGLPGCWWALSVFQWVRFLAAFRRLTSPQSMLFSTELIKKNLGELKAT